MYLYQWVFYLYHRCQILRALGRYEEALQVIDRCIKSSNCASILMQAYTQRGILKKYELKGPDSYLDQEDWDKSVLNDFQEAAKLGHPLASQLARKLNPYSAMCTAVMRDLLVPITSSISQTGQKNCNDQ